MPDTIIDAKFRVLEDLSKVTGRRRYLVSDLISSRLAILEHVPLDGFEPENERWTRYGEPALRERAERFARYDSFVPVTALGAWETGPYYVYEDDQHAALPDIVFASPPTMKQVCRLMEDIDKINRVGDHVLNLRPEHLRPDEELLRILPGAYILPLELLARSAARSPYQPPELRHAGLLGSKTDSYLVGAAVQALLERSQSHPPTGSERLNLLQTLEPDHRPTPRQAIEILQTSQGIATRAPRRSIERLADLRTSEDSLKKVPLELREALDSGVSLLAEGRRVMLFVQDVESGAQLENTFLEIQAQLSVLSDRPEITWIDRFTSWQAKDIQTNVPRIVLFQDWRPELPHFLPLNSLLSGERQRPLFLVIGIRQNSVLDPENPSLDLDTWLETYRTSDWVVQKCRLSSGSQAMPPSPTSPAAQHLLDLLSVLEVEAPFELLRLALPQQESNLPEAVAELENLGHVRRVLQAGGWWGMEPRLILRLLRPNALELRRQGLTTHRREELHLLLSHLLSQVGTGKMGQKYLRFHHLFAGGNWDAAAKECGPLLRWVQTRGLGNLMRLLQKKLVNSNLAHHFTVPHLLEVLRSLGEWEIGRNRPQESQSYYERASERLFSLKDHEVGDLDLEGVTDMILTHADLMEKRGELERALELLKRYLDRFDDGIPAADRGRVFSEMGFCEYRLGRFTNAEERCQLALKLLDSRRDPEAVAQLYSVLGLIRWKTSRYDEAEQYFNTSMALREKIGDRLAMARIYNNLGLLERSRGRFTEALEFHRRSMDIRAELGDQEGVAKNILNLAWAYYEMKDFERAEEFADRAASMSRELGMRSLTASAQGLRGDIYLERDRLDEARTVLSEAVTLAGEVGDKSELFMDLRKSATVELRSGNLVEAEQLLKASEKFLPSAGSTLEEANWYLTQGELKTAQRDLRGAALAHENAGNNFARLGNAGRAGDVFLKAAQLYHQSGIRSRTRELVGRARQLLSRQDMVLPKELIDLEADLGDLEPSARVAADLGWGMEVLTRVCTLASAHRNESSTIETILDEMRSNAGAQCAVFIGPDGKPYDVSSLSKEFHARFGRAEEVLARRPKLVSKALQTLLPIRSDEFDASDEDPFLVIPIEMGERNLGFVYLEWRPEEGLPPEPVRAFLLTLAQILGMVLERAKGADDAAVQMRALRSTAKLEENRDETSLDNIIGRSAARQAIVDFVRQVRDLEATVLLLGENGTGKEVVSRAIHFTGERRRFPFVTVNCTAIPEGLWERELFGHVRGAFTDAFESKRGHFERAHCGSLLLDEIGDMPWEMQTKFLRVLEEKRVTRIGGSDAIELDVRIIAATNQDLEAAVSAGRFRRDLYHRLNVLAITLPPLRERREDIPDLAQHFLDLHADRLKVPPKRLSGEALRILMRYQWPGNVRELENAMKGSLVLSDREVLVPEVLPASVLKGSDGSEAAGELDLDHVARWILDHASYSSRAPLMAGLEKALARQLVEKVGEKTMAAKMLGISKPTLYTRLKG